MKAKTKKGEPEYQAGVPLYGSSAAGIAMINRGSFASFGSRMDQVVPTQMLRMASRMATLIIQLFAIVISGRVCMVVQALTSQMAL